MPKIIINAIYDYYLREFVKRSPHCRKCALKRGEICFFADDCITHHFCHYKEKEK